MKNILVISASPRKNGNSDMLCDYFVEGAQQQKHNIEKVRLQEKNINYCLGCRVCATTKECIQKDDMSEIINQMLLADIIVLATPVYFFSMSAQLKTMIDRTIPCYKMMSNKEFYFFTTAAEQGKQYLFSTIDSLKGFVDNLDGGIVKGVIMAEDVKNMNDIKGRIELDIAYEYGLNV